MKNVFRLIGYLEGISYLLLLFIAVPLKYFGNNDIWVKSLGMPHGVLFIAFILLAVFMKPEYKWNNGKFITILLSSVIPFGTFYVDKKYFAKRNSAL